MICRTIYIISSVPADDKCNVGVTQLCQLIYLFDQVWFPPNKLLRLCFCCVRHIVSWSQLRKDEGYDTAAYLPELG